MMTVNECIKYVESHLEVKYATANGAYTAGKTISPEGCVNHSVGCAQPAVDVFFKIMNQASCGWGVNALLGDFHLGEGRILLTLKENTRPWGCGSGSKGSWNNTKIQWETCEPAGHTYAGGTMIGYDVAKNQVYFERMWKMLLAWNVYCVKKLGYPISGISDHSESYKAGYGSNHSDMMQWLPKHGKSMDILRAEVKAIIDAGDKTDSTASQTGLQATTFANLSDADAIAKVGPLFTEDQKANGILASVCLAQFILESGYGKSELAQKANNCFGMKKSLSGNTWAGSVWDGSSIYTKKTQEYENGQYVTITADFRKYPSVEKSIADHSAYLLNAMNGSKNRYAGLKGCTNHKQAIQIIKDGGYATSPTYIDSLLSIIDKWNLKQYDYNGTTSGGVSSADTTNYPAVPFLVKVIVSDLNIRSTPEMGNNVTGQTGKGTFTIVEVSNGWGLLKSYKSQRNGWIWLSNPEYCIVQDTVSGATTSSNVPFLVRVEISDLNIRSGPGTNFSKTGKYTGKGTFTITEVSAGTGSTVGWGKLKSGAGWISLDYATRI